MCRRVASEAVMGSAETSAFIRFSWCEGGLPGVWGLRRTEPCRGECRRFADCIGQCGAPRALGNSPMELFVQAQIDEPIALGLHGERIHTRGQFQKLGSFITRGMCREEHGGLRLERLPNHIMPLYVGTGGNPHAGSGTGPAF